MFQPPTDEGVIFDENNQPQRKVYYKYHDRYQWIDENGNPDRIIGAAGASAAGAD
ncbi:MAG: hypothetical protein U5K75_09440 [Ahrensia sp.]|nr:hypothetical protein [Ahrensia sp.]